MGGGMRTVLCFKLRCEDHSPPLVEAFKELDLPFAVQPGMQLVDPLFDVPARLGRVTVVPQELALYVEVGEMLVHDASSWDHWIEQLKRTGWTEPR